MATDEKSVKAIIGERIRLAREEHGWSQQKLSELISKAVPTISHWEAGLRSPRLEDMSLISAVLERPLSYFWGQDYENQEIVSVYEMLEEPFQQHALAYMYSLLYLQMDIHPDSDDQTGSKSTEKTERKDIARHRRNYIVKSAWEQMMNKEMDLSFSLPTTDED